MDRRVHLSSCGDYEYGRVKRAVHEIFEAFGGAKALCGGRNVLIKPNLLMPRSPDEVTTTHPHIIKAIAEEFAPIKVTIADSCGGPYNKALLKMLYNKCGMQTAAAESGAVLNYDTSHKDVAYPNGVICKSFPIITPVAGDDFIISAAKLKTHMLAYYTGAVKNMFGVIPGLHKVNYHRLYPDMTDFCGMLVDLCECVSPSFSIIDGVVGMEGRGPSGGRAKHAGIILGGMNPHGVDLAGARVMGLDVKRIITLTDAIERGLCPGSADELEYTGEDAEGYELRFTPSVGGKGMSILPKWIRPFASKFIMPYPQVMAKKCIGCGNCARSCPESAIKIEDKLAEIDRSKCIKCYCCHELCPVKAIKL